MEVSPSVGCKQQVILTYVLKKDYESMNKYLDDQPILDFSDLMLSLQLAINFNDPNAISIICRNIPDINDPEIRLLVSRGSPSHPLTYSLYQGKLEASTALLAAGADPKLVSEENNGQNALYYACKNFRNSIGMYELIREMLAKGAKDHVNLKVEWTLGGWNYPLHEAVTCYEACLLVKLLIENGADTEVLDSHGESPLHTALKFNKIESAQALIDGGANPFAVKQLSFLFYPPEEMEESVELLHKARVNWLFKNYKDLYLLYKTTGLIDSQVDGLRDFFLVEIWYILHKLWLHDTPS